MLRLVSPTTQYERDETIAILGEELSYKLFGIAPLLDTNVITEESVIVTEESTRYKRQNRLAVFIRQVRKETMFCPIDWSLPDTIQFCFGDLFWLFDTQFNLTGQRQNFLSYGYFVNRILELHGRHELKEKLEIREPKTARVRNNNARLWRMYLDHLQKNHGLDIGSHGRH